MSTTASLPIQPETGWPVEAQVFLNELYAKYGSDQTDEQKCNVLHRQLYGNEEVVITYSHNPTPEQKRAMYEYEILHIEGLIELVLC
jgi:hypothetical protein